MVKNTVLGIDAGGTFTDIACLSLADASVTASAKTPTDRSDLVGTICRGLDLIAGKVDLCAVKAVNLATTFATNAIVEGKTHGSVLVLIGYDKEQVKKYAIEGNFGTDRLILIGGGHDTKGNELEPLDLSELRSSIKKIGGPIKSVAVSGFFSVRNPSHEIAAKEEILSIYPNTHITCGHELSSDLDAMLRAATASLNAGLIPIVIELLDSVETVLSERGMDVPLSVVRGDGTLVSSEWAKKHPIEMIVSGPAASAVGAAFLGSENATDRGSWVVDIGGTTMDIIYLDKDRLPKISPHGATIGRYKTLIKAIEISTFGLGGDSRVTYNRNTGEYEIGPGRVIPLCSAVSANSSFSEALAEIRVSGEPNEPLLLIRDKIDQSDGDFGSVLKEGLKDGHLTRESLLANGYLTRISYPRLEEMHKSGSLDFAGFTPTDALHVLGKLDKWDLEASKRGAEVLARGDEDIKVTANKIYSKFVAQAAFNIFNKSMGNNGFVSFLTEDTDRLFIKMLIESPKSGPALEFKLNSEVIGVGAPAWAFIREAASLLGEKGKVPQNAEVAGAVGAAVSSFSMKYSVWITPMKDGIFRVHLPTGICDFEDLDEAVSKTEDFMRPWVRMRAEKTGASDPIVECDRVDEKAETSGGTKVHLWTELLYSVKDRDNQFLRG